MLAAFDKDGSGQLTGEERRAANIALAAGKVPGAASVESDVVELAPVPGEGPPAAGGGGGAGAPARAAGEATAGPEGRRSREEVRERMRTAMLERFDANKDGEIDDAEREAAREQTQARFTEMRDRFLQRRFDADGDGQLSEAETAEMNKAQEGWRARADAARAEFMERFDADKDGQISEPEREAVRESFRAQIEERRQAFMAEWDKDGDRELSDDERAAMLIDRELARLLERRLERR